MRLIYSDEVKELSKKIDLYLKCKGPQIYLSEEAPEEIRQSYERYLYLIDKEHREAEEYFRNLKVELNE